MDNMTIILLGQAVLINFFITAALTTVRPAIKNFSTKIYINYFLSNNLLFLFYHSIVIHSDLYGRYGT